MIALLSAPVLNSVFGSKSSAQGDEGQEIAEKQEQQSGDKVAPAAQPSTIEETPASATPKLAQSAIIPASSLVGDKSAPPEDNQSKLLRSFSTATPRDLSTLTSSDKPSAAATETATSAPSADIKEIDPARADPKSDKVPDAQSFAGRRVENVALGTPIPIASGSKPSVITTETRFQPAQVPETDEKTAKEDPQETKSRDTATMSAASPINTAEHGLAGNSDNAPDVLKQELKAHQEGESCGPVPRSQPLTLSTGAEVPHPESEGPHGLVWQDGKYVHRRQLDPSKPHTAIGSINRSTRGSAVGTTNGDAHQSAGLSNGHAQPMIGAGGIEMGVPVQENANGTYEGVGEHGQNLSRPKCVSADGSPDLC